MKKIHEKYFRERLFRQAFFFFLMSVYKNNPKVKYHNPANKSDFSVRLGFENELIGQG